MALVKCPDCGRDVSERAPVCPGCGAPIAVAPNAAPSYRPVQTIEQTAKRWKKMRLTGLGLVCLSPVSCAIGGEVMGSFGWASLFTGFAMLTYARFGTWWHHG